MTPEERAAALLREWELPGIEEWGGMMRDDIAAALTAAVQAERERCARVVETLQPPRDASYPYNARTLEHAAAAIREGEDA